MSQRPLNIAVISKADAYGGGASKCAQDLTQLLSQAGHQAHHLARWFGDCKDPSKNYLLGRVARWRGFLFDRAKEFGLPEMLPMEWGRIKRFVTQQSIDLVHLHDTPTAVSPWSILWLSRLVPVVWTIHDCSPFTGGCLYPMDCTRFQWSCNDCPQVGTWPLDNPFVFTGLAQRVRAMVHHSPGVQLVTPSHWMADMAASAWVSNGRPLVIANGVNVGVYQALNKAELRGELGIPPGRLVILLSAGHLRDPRKGVAESIAVLQGIKDLKPFVLLAGQSSPELRQLLSGLDYHEFGYLTSPEALNRAYAAADGFLFCSWADNQPLSVLEAMASGTAVVGFATGGIPDLVVEGETGTMAPTGDVEGVIHRLRHAVAEGKLGFWGRNARQRAVEQFSFEGYLARHLDLYYHLLDHP